MIILFYCSALRAFEQRPAPRRIRTTHYRFPIVPAIHIIVAKLFREIACRRWLAIATHCEWCINLAASWANPPLFHSLPPSIFAPQFGQSIVFTMYLLLTLQAEQVPHIQSVTNLFGPSHSHRPCTTGATSAAGASSIALCALSRPRSKPSP